MAIEFSIDHRQGLVVARCFGVFTEDDAFGYQREGWSSPEVAGFNELIDMTAVQAIAPPANQSFNERIQQLVAASVARDAPTPSRCAIVAPHQFAFGLGRMYQSYREADPRSTKEVGVFHTMKDALAYLGIKGLDPAPVMKTVEAPPRNQS